MRRIRKPSRSVLCTGGFSRPPISASHHRSYCDSVAIARPLIANNDLVNSLPKARTCLLARTYCNRCLVHAIKDPLGCYEVSLQRTMTK